MYNHIYGLNTNVFSDEKIFGIYYNTMPQNRKLKIDHMKFDKDKRLSLGAGVLIQKALDFFELSYTDIYYNKYGKPLISCKDDAFFNISHSGNIVVCAVSDYQIGVNGIWLAVVAAEILTLIFSVIFLITNRKKYHY